MLNIQIIINFILFIQILSNSCYNFEDAYDCETSIENWDNRCFQTPPRGSEDYKETYQDMAYLVGYAQLKYSSNKTICNITFITKINTEKLEKILFIDNYKIIYTFGEIEQEDNYIILNSEEHKFPNGLNLSAKIINTENNEEFAKLKLEEEYFIWDNPKIDIYSEEIYKNGQRGTIVELIGWSYDDISEECDYLKIAGYLVVKITPPNEHVFTENWIEEDGLNPWEYFIQPVSYKLHSRLGNKNN